MKPKYFTLSASVIYLMGVLVGCRLDPVIHQGSIVEIPDFHQSTVSRCEMVLEIGWNNVSVVLINLLGAFSLGIIPLLNTFYNGTVLGYAVSVATTNVPFMGALEHLLPHSIEIVAIIMSCSLGFQLGVHLFE